MAKLIEGKSYSFKIDGIITLPDDKSSFKIVDPNGVSHLLDYSTYLDYGLKPGNFISCRVDKINCTGKIYLEPEHPYYKPGKTYEFSFEHFESLIKTTGEHQQMAVFKDEFAKQVSIPLDDLNSIPIKGQKFNFVITRIKKGQLFISTPGSINDYTGLKENSSYLFTYSHIKTYSEKYEYYVFINEAGKEFQLRFKFYKNYNFEIGKTIKCTYRLINNQSFLEPQHPYYKVGEEYLFEIIGESIIHKYPFGEEKAFVLKNEFGKDILLAKGQIKKTEGNHIKCEVTDIIMSRIFLSCP